MYTKDNSWNSFATHMIEEGYAKDEDTLLKHMALIPTKSREIIEKRWGLIEKVYYSDFEQLNEQMGIDNARELYFEAMRDLFNAEYAAIAMKRYNMQTISNWNEVVALGMLFAQDTTTADTTENLGKEEEVAVAKKDNSELLKRPLIEFENLNYQLYIKLNAIGINTLEDLLNYDTDAIYKCITGGSNNKYFTRPVSSLLIQFINSLGITNNEGKKLCHYLAKRDNLNSLLIPEKKVEDLTRPLTEFTTLSDKTCQILNNNGFKTLEDLLNYEWKGRYHIPEIAEARSEELIILINSLGFAQSEGKKLCDHLMKLYPKLCYLRQM